MAADHRGLSLWLDMFDGDLSPAPTLSADLDVDVAIVGGGFTGLWTAYYLLAHDPGIRVAVLEREICGFGASGRNGGWCVGELVAGVGTYARIAGHDEAMRLMREVFATVDEIGRVAAAEGIHCRFAKGGAVYVARNAAQHKRQLDLIEEERAHGFTEDEIRLLSPDEARTKVNATDIRSGIHFAPCAALDPARLVRGLRDLVIDRGAQVFEQTGASSIEPGRVQTPGGTVRADVVVRATEGYTRDLPGERRSMVPLYSLMIATEPLPAEIFDEIGLEDRPTFADGRYAVIYGQRTADDRIAFGGRGVPYLYGSRIDPSTERHAPTHDLVHRTLVELFPVLAEARITHRWGGVLGAPRTWTPSVAFDRSSGMAAAGGYVGEGVAPSNLAGRTLADLITATDSPVTSLPWVNVPDRKWEPEPFRWLGVWGTRKIMMRADHHENRTERESRLGAWAAAFLS
ncbi:MAG: NAD(P)/FAD-dependent oxidoreductase [Acidimicrobiales bacterium]